MWWQIRQGCRTCAHIMNEGWGHSLGRLEIWTIVQSWEQLLPSIYRTPWSMMLQHCWVLHVNKKVYTIPPCGKLLTAWFELQRRASAGHFQVILENLMPYIPEIIDICLNSPLTKQDSFKNCISMRQHLLLSETTSQYLGWQVFRISGGSLPNR